MVIGVVLILIGVAVQPSVATVQPENNDVEYFDVITEFVGLEKNYTTQLTKEEIKRLDELFDSISNNLNKSGSFEKNIDIFKEAIIELNSFGLLGDIGIDEAEKLVTNYYQNPKLMKNLKRVYNIEKGALNEDKNIFCLIAGEATGLLFISSFGEFLALLMFESTIFVLYNLGFMPFYFSLLLAFCVYSYNIMIGIFIPFCLARSISFYKTLGEIITYGLLGRKYWEGKIVGKFDTLIYEDIGVIGFTGIKIQILTYPNVYFIGSALSVHLEGS